MVFFLIKVKLWGAGLQRVEGPLDVPSPLANVKQLSTFDHCMTIDTLVLLSGPYTFGMSAVFSEWS